MIRIHMEMSTSGGPIYRPRSFEDAQKQHLHTRNYGVFGSNENNRAKIYFVIIKWQNGECVDQGRRRRARHVPTAAQCGRAGAIG